MTEQKKKSESSKQITIGYLVHQMLNDVSQEYFKGVYQAAFDNNVNLIIAGIGAHYFTDFEESSDIGLNKLQILNKNHFDGIIIWSSGMSYYYYKRKNEFIKFVEKFKGIPIVNIGLPLFDFPTVLTNNIEGVEKIMEHLINDHKYKNIGFLRGSKDHFSGAQRFETYLNVLKKYDIPFNKEMVSPHCHYNERGVKLGIEFFRGQIKKGILKPGENLDAIAAVSDYYAIPLIKEFQSMGIRVPEDLAVTGFNNYFEGEFIEPDLTSVDPNLYQVGYIAVTTLLKLINREKLADNLIYPPVKVIIRKSCGCSDIIPFEENYLKQNSINRENLKRFIDNITNYLLAHKVNFPQQYFTKSGNFNLPKIFDKFQNDATGKTKEEFLSYFQEILMKPDNEYDSFISLQKTFSQFWSLLTCDFDDREFRDRVYKLLYSGNHMLYSNINNLTMLTYKKFYYYADILRTINITISKKFNTAEIFNELKEILFKLKIPESYFFIFNKPGDFRSTAKISFAYKDFKRLKFSDKDYNTENHLIPLDFIKKDSRYVLLFDTLIFESQPLGYFLLDIKNIDNKFIGYIYEVLTSIISSSYYGAIILDKMEKAQKEKEIFLNILEKQNIELENAIKAAKKANKAKNDFLAVISHEIKTPLTVMIGLVEKILMVDDKKEQNKFGNLAINESQKITQLINQLLELSRMEADKLIIYNKPFSLLLLIKEIDEAFKVIIQKKGLDFKTSVNFDIENFIIGDEMRLRQIIANLLSNAVKFTDLGGIQLTVDIIKRQKKSILIKFQVIDTGIGIHEDMQGKIFELFTRGEEDSDGRYEGTGLGTTIAKQLVELMGGTIGLKSAVGKGSTFWFSIPFKTGSKLEN